MRCRSLMLSTAAAIGAVLGAGVAAAAPSVVADTAATHSIVARVMQGVSAPLLLVPPGTSPHGYAMRPSEATALQEAELVFWIGEALTPWLEEPLDALAGDAVVVELIEARGVNVLPGREGGSFEAHVHDAEHAHDDEHAHGEEHAHGDEHAHGEEHVGEHEQDHGGTDAHVWLDPANAAVMAETVGDALAAADPQNAAAYRENAADFAAEMTVLQDEIAERLAPVRGGGFVVFHDAYQYFETAFGMPAAGSVALGDAERPSAARVAEIRERVLEADIACIFAEPQFEPALIRTVTEGTAVRSGTLDPLGVALEPGPDLYPQLLRDLADALGSCLGAES